MNTVLAITWRPTPNDLERFQRLHPLLTQLYSGLSIATSPGIDPMVAAKITALPHIRFIEGRIQVENRRLIALRQALEFADAEFIHACDGDHALARLDRFRDDWQRSITAMKAVDCLIIGRSQPVFDSYPSALRETERLINIVGSYLLGQSVDLGSGARGFSRRAVEYLALHASPQTHGIATDSEWPVLLHRAGFKVGTYESEGAIYEVYDEDHRTRLENVDQWAKRVELARLIIEAGINAAMT